MENVIQCKNHVGDIVEEPASKFKIRICGYGLIIREKKILVMKNRQTGKFWFPGGGSENNETPEETVQREVVEETGLAVKIGNPLFTTSYPFFYQPDDEGYKITASFFSCELDESILARSPYEIDPQCMEAEWIPLADLTEGCISDLSPNGTLAPLVCEHIRRLIA